MRTVAGVLLLLSFGLIIFGWIGLIWLSTVCGGAVLYGVRSGIGARGGLGRLDDLVFAGERAIVVVSLLVMAGVVFLDVVWRTAYSVTGSTGTGFAIALFLLTMLGAFTARWPNATPLKRALAGVGAYAAMAVAVLVIRSARNGFGWSQTLAMVLLLWVGLIGTSMATKEGRHIAVDAVRRVLPDRFKRSFELTAGLVTAAVSTFLAVLAVLYCRQNWIDWTDSGGRAFVFESIAIPYWAATLPIPIGFGLTAARFISVALYGAKEVDVLTSVGGADLEVES